MAKGEITPIPCPYCGVDAVFKETSVHLYQRDYGPVWQCDPCRAWVGCHPDGRPLGRLANKELREAKQRAHAAFDPLIAGKIRRDGCTKQRARASGYKWLAAQMEINPRYCHIGFMDEAQCARVVEICHSVGRKKDDRP